MTIAGTDRLLERVAAGEHLSREEILELASAHDILSLGTVADAVRRRLHGTRVTYVRVALCPFDRSFGDAVSLAAREVRVTGSPDTLRVAVTAVEAAKAVAGDRLVSGFSWADIDRLASTDGVPLPKALADLHGAGLDAFAEVPLDTVADPAAVVDLLLQAGFRQLRLSFAQAPAADRTSLLLAAAALQSRFGGIQAINPLPTVIQPSRPSTGYEDVKAVAIARLAAPNIPTIQIDWPRYGPKLAQVALTFGADDLDAVSASNEAPDGRRRAPIEEVRRNIEAAGFSAAERDGRFNLV